MDLVGPKVVNVVWATACRLHPGRHRVSVGPDIVGVRCANKRTARDEPRNHSVLDQDHFRLLVLPAKPTRYR